ncbi:MAG TPA: GAF domain-containing protein [bacterium (Candidatus Stahlbacteria)]|nr:GAF domain-containing protein [Candidatus Stahlbacteria bacterium]
MNKTMKVAERAEELKQKIKELTDSRRALLNILEDVDEAREQISYLKELNEDTVQNIDEVIWVIDKEMNVLICNKAIEKLLKGRVKANNLIGKNIYEALPFLRSYGMDKEYEEVFKTGIQMMTKKTINYAGKEIITEIRNIPIKNGQNEVEKVISIIRDITEKERAAQEKARLEQQRDALIKISSKIMQEKNLEKILREIAKSVTKYGGFRRAAISLINENFDAIAVAFAGLTDEEEQILRNSHMSSEDRKAIFQDEYRVGNSYYIPHGSKLLKERSLGGIKSRLSPEDMIDWHPDDYLFIPLYGKDKKVVGLISVDDPVDGRAPTKESLQPVEMFANQAAIAIENARLFEEEQQMIREISAINTIVTTVNESLDLEEILVKALDKVLEIMNMEAGAVYLLAEDGATLMLITHRGISKQFAKAVSVIQKEEGLTGRTIKASKAITVDISAYEHPTLYDVVKEQGFKTFVSIPLICKGKVLGIIHTGTRKAYSFSHEELDLLTTIGNQIGIAIENAKLFQSVNRKLQEIHAYNSIGSMIANSSEVNIVLDLIIKKATDLLQGRGGLVALRNTNGNVPHIVAAAGLVRSLKGSAVGTDYDTIEWILKNQKALICDDISSDPRINKNIVSGIDIKSIAAVPMMKSDKIIGTMMVINKKTKAGKFYSDDINLLNSFANQAVIAIEKANFDIGEQPFKEIIGVSPQMRAIFNQMQRLLNIDTPVLIEGETGTGKELVAKAIHFYGKRKNGLFLAVNCGALPETLLESELFGYKKGTFTDANEDRQGIFEAASGGTVFLDEIGEMSLALQVKLLRVLQEGEITRIGERQPRKVDVRVISATNRELERLVEEGKFRKDLFYRLNVVRIKLPPLRERKGDIVHLAHHLLQKHAMHHQKKVKGFTKEAMELLSNYSWPGNVRELENEIERAIALTNGEMLTVESFSDRLRGIDVLVGEAKREKQCLKDIVSHIERKLIVEALERNNWIKKDTAKALGISRPTLDEKIEKYKISKKT